MPEVACSDAIRQARVTRVASKGLSMLKQVSLKRSEAGAHNVFKKFGQSIDVKISKTTLPTKPNFPFVEFSNWMRYLVEYDSLEYLVGVQNVEDMNKILTTFWQRFEILYPEHVIAHRAEGDRGFKRSMCIPVLYHGDEGRGLKKKQLMVLSTHGAIGKGTLHANNGKTKQELEDPLGPLNVNMIGHSYSNHFLQCVLPISLYGEEPAAFEHMLQLQADEFSRLFWDGIVVNEQRFYVACIGVKGDSPFIQKSGLFERSFTRRPRAPTSRTAAAGICHRCLAGKESCVLNGRSVDIPYEELGVESPMWRQTIGALPSYSTPSPLLQIPYERSGDQTGLWKFDIFHNFHSGVGKYFVASGVVVCMELIQASIDESFLFLTQDFSNYCKEKKESPYHKKISKSLVGVEHSFKDCPDGGWTKGDFTRLMCQWFGDYTERHVVGKTADPLYLKTVSWILMVFVGCTACYIFGLFGVFHLLGPTSCKLVDWSGFKTAATCRLKLWRWSTFALETFTGKVFSFEVVMLSGSPSKVFCFWSFTPNWHKSALTGEQNAFHSIPNCTTCIINSLRCSLMPEGLNGVLTSLWLGSKWKKTTSAGHPGLHVGYPVELLL